MRRAAALATTVAAALLPLAGCTARHDRPAGPPGRYLRPAAARVVLLSIDGLAAARHRALVASGGYADPDGLAAIDRAGFVVERATPVNPTLTSVNHVSIVTGAFPGRTGVVSNVFHPAGAPVWKTVAGFDAPIGTETLWESFRRQGRRVGSLGWPGCDATAPGRTADFGTTWVASAAARAETLELGADAFAPETGATADEGEATPRRARLEVALRGAGLPETVAFQLVAVDTVPDRVAAYDTLVVDDNLTTADGVLASVHTGEWFPLSFAAAHADGGTQTVGGWCLLQALPGDLEGVRVYRGAFHATAAYPRDFRERLEAEAGFWPGPGDDDALARGLAGRGGLGIGEYMTQVRRFSEYFTACTTAAVRGEPFDLLLTYQPIVDEVQHGFTIVDPRQPAYSEGLAATAAATVDDVYRLADRAVGDLARALNPGTDALVVVSDHGILPVWEGVYVNEVLRGAGLVEVEETARGLRPAASSRMVAVTSGGAAQLYVNLEGREPGGVVPVRELDEVVRRAARALALVEVDGVPVVERTFTRSELAGIGLDSPNSGDLVVFFAPGFYPSSRLGRGVHEPIDLAGQHGFFNDHPELDAVWLARGLGVRRGRLERASVTQVAAYVSHLAGIDPPAGAAPFAP